MIAYISFGNSDDKLGQREWVRFQLTVRSTIRATRAHIHGEWYSAPDSSYQNMCFCIDLPDEIVPELKGELAAIAQEFQQDAIAWAEAQGTTFLGAQTYTTYHATEDKALNAAGIDKWGHRNLNHPGSDRWTGGDKKSER